MTEDEMPYGSTLVKNTEFSVPLQYDRRFIEDALAEKLGHYYHALQENDAAEFSAVLLYTTNDICIHEKDIFVFILNNHCPDGLQ
jgi:hypothetical protein